MSSVLLGGCTLVVELPKESSGGAGATSGAAGETSAAGAAGEGGSPGGQAGSSAGASGNVGGGSTGGAASSGGTASVTGGASAGGDGGVGAGGAVGTGGTGAGGSASGAGGAGGTCPDRDDDGETDQACGGTDCDDNDGNVYSGQTTYFATQRDSGGYDYNCSGTEEKELTTFIQCSGLGVECESKPTSYLGSLPECGASGDYGKCQSNTLNLLCEPQASPESRPMKCR